MASKLYGVDATIIIFVFVLYCIVLYCIVLYCIVLYRIVLYCIVLYCIVLYCIVLYCIVLYCIVLYCIVLYCIVLYCIVLYCIVFYCIVLYCIVLYCIVLYCIVMCCIFSSQQAMKDEDASELYLPQRVRDNTINVFGRIITNFKLCTNSLSKYVNNTWNYYIINPYKKNFQSYNNLKKILFQVMIYEKAE